MNKTKIEWCSHTWNPVTGCWGPGGTAEKPNRCPYCYAERMAYRFQKEELGSFIGKDFDPFTPQFHPDRLSQPTKVKKTSKIFVCSMSDLFGDWVPSEWILDVQAVARSCPQHIFQFLTKNPKRLSLWNGTWPDNAWVGTTVTNQTDADERLPWLLKVDAPVRFVSHEPLLGPIDIQYAYGFSDNLKVIDWAIIGAQTGPGAVLPRVDWVMDLAQQYRDAGVPLFLKDNLGFKNQPQEFPA